MAGQKKASASSSSSTANGGAMAVFKPGNIVRIRMNNFLTYSDVEVRPGPNLNVVVGPNGSGKSTILCAIALGLGAPAKFLERGDSVSEFVMRDKEKGWVEIELKGEGDEKHVIRRDMERASNSTGWKYNGKTSTLGAIRKIVEDLHIQVENLCTFLPQEKVGKFTEMNAQQLLVETEKALSGTTLHKDHMKLIELQKGAHGQVQAREAAEEELKRLEEQNSALEADRRKMEERQRHLAEVELLTKVHAWCKYHDTRLRAIKVKEDVDELKVKVTEAQAELQPFKEKVEGLAGKEKSAAAGVKKCESRMTKALAGVKEKEEGAEAAEAKLSTALNKLNEMDEQRAKKQKGLADMEKQLQEEYRKRDSFNVDKCKEEMTQLKAQQREVKNSKDMITSQAAQAKDRADELDQQLRLSRDKLTQLKDHRRQRLERFRNAQMRGARDACEIKEWVEHNRDRFTGRVYGPVALEIDIKDSKVAAAIETQISQTLTSFVVENSHDKDVLIRVWRDEKKKKPTVNVLGSNWRHELERRTYTAGQLASLKAEDGIQGVLQDFIEAPEPVLAILSSQAGISKVLVGDQHTEARIRDAQLLERLCGGGSSGDDEEDYDTGGGGKRSCSVYTIASAGRNGGNVTTSHNGRISKFSGNLTSNMRSVRPARVLGGGGSGDAEQEVAELEARLPGLEKELQDAQKKFSGFDGKLDQLQREYNNLQRKINDCQNQLKNRGGIAEKIKRMEDKVANLRRELAQDTGKRKDELRKHAKQHTLEYIGHIVQMVDKVTDVRQSLTEKVGPRVVHDMAKTLHRHAQQALRDRADEFRALEREYNEKCREKEQLKEAVVSLRAEATRKADLQDPANVPVHERVEQLKTEDRFTVPHVESLITEAQTAADSITDNPEVLRQYQRRKAEIETKTKELQKLRSECENRAGQLEAMLGPWRAKLKNVADKLNARFSLYMTQMGCAGEVKLDDSNDGDYAEWGMKIRVKFRDHNEMQDLSARVQSGGERSVSTILYLMGLQELMDSPFRAVDEINQGMDERNERLVFARIVANSRSTQYFLVTPKLLPRLTALEMPHVTVLFVFNAAGLLGYDQWDLHKLLEAARALKRKREGRTEDDEEEEDEEEMQQGAGGSRSVSKKGRVA